MRALKSVLGTSLMGEQRMFLGEKMTFYDIIARFLSEVKSRAEAHCHQSFEFALSGRPVRFHSVDAARNAKAEADLVECYARAGFKDVRFLVEPEAAALASGVAQGDELSLIVDIGGGTSDFSVFRAHSDGIAILANHGVRIGGTDFDRSINFNRVMPLLGKGTELRKAIGPGATPVPVAIYNDLATWEKIPFLYTAKTRRMVEDMARMAYEPDKMNRLATVLEDELGHDLAFAVERGKIAANSGDANSIIALDQIERGLSTTLPIDVMAEILDVHAQALREGARETLRMAQIDTSKVQRVIYVGGSSLMSMVSDTMKAQFPKAEHSFSEVFTAVTDGLALAAARR